MSIKILLADDHNIVRSGIRAVLEKETDFKVVAEAENGREALQLVAKICPDIAVMDIAMPGLNGVEATRQIAVEFPRTKVIALSSHADKRFILDMIQAGAAGYLQKNCALTHLVSAIRNVTAGQVYLSPTATGVMIETLKERAPGAPVADNDLSAKEREVLQLLAEGCTSKEIADRLSVSPKTIDTHRQHIMDKLRMHSIAELTKYAIRQGLTSIDD